MGALLVQGSCVRCQEEEPTEMHQQELETSFEGNRKPVFTSQGQMITGHRVPKTQERQVSLQDLTHNIGKL